MDIFDDFPNVEQIVAASEFFCQHLKSRKGFEPSLELCLTALTVDLDLHEKLKSAHDARDLAALERLCVYLERNAWRMNSRFKRMNQAIRSINSENKIMPFVRADREHPIWAPTRTSTNPNTTDHIRNLALPLGNREDIPLVVLHQLGSFQHDTILRKRLNRIFSPDHHTFLINTSGSGKTKLLFEGLCLHWGFYFSCAIDSSDLGAGDFVLAIDDLESNRDWTGHLPFRSSPRYTANLQNNIKTVFRLNSEALLARLLVFKMYLEACSKEGFRHYHRRRWLESQIFPHTLASSFEPYGKLKREIARAEVDDSVIDEAITRTLEDIQRIWHISPGEFFYVVIDEANIQDVLMIQRIIDVISQNSYRHSLRSQTQVNFLSIEFGIGYEEDNNFESPHTLLGGFVESLSEYMPPENSEYSVFEKFYTNNWYSSLGSKGLLRRSISTIAMHRTIISFLTTSKGCLDIPGNDIALINEDYGIFLDTMCSRIGLDEPATVAYGANWFKQNPYFTLVKLAGTFAWNYATEIHPSHFALSLALSLALCYADFSKISDTFTLFGLTGAPEEVVSWFRHERDEPFCVLPSSSSTGVTLAFCLQLSDERTFWVFVYVPSTFTADSPDFAQDIKEIHPHVIFRDQPEVLTLLDQLPNLNTDVGPSGILRISGSFWVKSATANSIPREEYPAGVLNIEGLDKVTKEVSQDMLMRRLSRIFTQGERMEASHMALPAVARGDVSVKKRGRSTSTADGAALTSKADGTKVQKSSKGIVTGSGSMTRKSRKGTRSLRTRRSNGNMRDVVTGRASVVVPRTSLVDSTVPSSSSVSPYNLRKRK
ncbi:hypothetical protein LENED_005662 [Lentinula edodes]|uniref:Uncharacterized protein n=1 Tax=Lentinula edodes TaxID=5353 RepID=A0A1Q3E9L2_LENED|nr:hypothetical protein LENED_005662 [Lentinula edodes]